ncbi:MAG: 30S ribosomal protein S6 [Clostridiales bacterium]|nr:30S ribosomal protein S6 [Clostridiales bacterium]
MENKYEVLFIIKMGATDAAKEKIIGKYTAMIEKAGGKVDLVDKWGNRRFAYPINFKLEGFYALIYFTSKPSFIKELERVMRISDDIVRHMVINRNGLTEPQPRKKRETQEKEKIENTEKSLDNTATNQELKDAKQEVSNHAVEQSTAI